MLSIKVIAPPSLSLVAPLLPLANPFIFNPLFSLLPNLLSYDTP